MRANQPWVGRETTVVIEGPTLHRGANDIASSVWVYDSEADARRFMATLGSPKIRRCAAELYEGVLRTVTEQRGGELALDVETSTPTVGDGALLFTINATINGTPVGFEVEFVRTGARDRRL